MKLFKYVILSLSVALLLASCGAKKKVNSNTTSKKVVRKTVVNPKEEKSKTVEIAIPKVKKDLSTQAYINEYVDIAVNQMRMHHIPASITLAQGILESRSGNSDLTRVSNNHFGIKCHKNWEGAFVKYDDDKKDECFRVYDYPASSFEDHSRFLTERKRYAKLFELKKGDYKAWAKGLRKAGYATDKKYPQKLIRIIEKYELYKYDEKVLDEAVNDPNIYIVQKGDGLYGISRKFNIKLSKLMSINGLTNSNIFPGQKLLLKPSEDQIVQPLKEVNKTPVQKTQSKDVSKPELVRENKVQEVPEQKKPTYHIVKEGETLYQIAYKYKLEVPDLRRWNGIRKAEISVGQRIFINNPYSIDTINNNANSHTVVPEDTLYSIAKRYHTTVPELMRLNHLKDYTIYIGQVLIVK